PKGGVRPLVKGRGYVEMRPLEDRILPLSLSPSADKSPRPPVRPLMPSGRERQADITHAPRARQQCQRLGRRTVDGTKHPRLEGVFQVRLEYLAPDEQHFHIHHLDTSSVRTQVPASVVFVPRLCTRSVVFE